MKKTLFLLLALSSVAAAETYTLTQYDVAYKSDTDSSSTLTAGNRAITWNNGTDAYKSWYMEFTMPTVNRSDYIASLTTGAGGYPSKGLSVSAKTGSLTIGCGDANVYLAAGSLTFSTTDALSFCYYDGTAYIGNRTTKKYIAYTLASTDTTLTTMTSGTSRAWANGSNTGTTQLGATTIASLDSDSLVDLDVVTLVRSGVAQSIESSTVEADGNVFAVSEAKMATVVTTVNAGSSGNSWVGALGNAAVPATDNNDIILTGGVTMVFNGEYTGGAPTDGSGGTTAFGVVNGGSVTDDVNLVFDADNAEYGSFSSEEGKKTSVAGAFRGSIGGKFNATINKGTFHHDIIGGIHTGSTDSIGATNITINGGTIKGNVYGGGREGTISGDTAITITSLTPFADHTAASIISGGGIGGTISGKSTVTFSGITSGSYLGTVSGGSNVSGSSTLVLDGSTISIAKVTDFDRFSLKNNSTLTVTDTLTTAGALNLSDGGTLKLADGADWKLSSMAGATAVYDSATAASKTTNGLGAGVVSGLISGTGSLIAENGATLNGKTISGYDAANKTITVADAVYYVVAPQNDTEYNHTDKNYHYVLSADKTAKFTDVVNVGNHAFETGSGPFPNAEANGALGYYVAQGGTLCIAGDSTVSGLSAGEMLVNTAGDGDIIVRSAGYQNDKTPFSFSINGKTQATGNFYLNPFVMENSTVEYLTYVYMSLEEGADISSFKSVNFGYQASEILIKGKIGADSKGNHINNLSTLGSYGVCLYVLPDANEEIVLGGTTTIQSHVYYEPKFGSGHTAGRLDLMIHRDSSVTIRHLSSGNDDAETAFEKEVLWISAKPTEIRPCADEVHAAVNIDSFDYRGKITINGHQGGVGTVDVRVNLLEDQWITDSQYEAPYWRSADLKPSFTLTGSGTYVLSEGQDIQGNIGRLSTETKDDARLWQGTVQVNNLDGTSTGRGIDFAFYGNEKSTVDFRGFKGDVVTWDESGVVITGENVPESVTIAQALKLTNTDSMNAYEVTGGIATQEYTGSISGEGDFVVSAAESKNIKLSGDISKWNGSMKATAGSQNLQLSGSATTVNAAIKADGGELALTVDNSGKDTTFNKAVEVTSLTISKGSVAKLAAESTAGDIKVTSRGADVAVLSDGLSISDSKVSGGAISNAAITSSTTAGKVTLENITATDLYLYGGADVEFYSEEAEAGFVFSGQTGNTNNVRFTTDAFKGMTLSKDGAAISLAVSNTVDWTGADEAEWNNVIIYLEGFTIEGLSSSGEWDWETAALSLDVAEATTFSSGASVAELLKAEYESITYTQTASGLTIRMMSVPEPTTTALSLLALAGLAARRRRK